MKKFTSFTSVETTEGETIAYTYSEIDDTGRIISRNNKETFICMDATTINHLQGVRKYIQERLEQN